MAGPTAETLLAALPSALLLIDEGGRIAQVNVAAEVMLNASAAHLRHKPLGSVMRLPTACVAGVGGEAAFAAFDIAIEREERVTVHIDLHATPIVDHPGYRLITLENRAATQAMGNRLDQRDRTRSAIGAAAMLAHEIKNPLAGIRGAAQLLEAHAGQSDGLDGEGGMSLTRLIRDEVDRVTSLIDRMEAFTDTRPLECETHNIYAILEHVRAVAIAGLGDRIDIDDAYDPSLPAVFVNRDALVQVLLNLLGNAADAVPSDRRGTVTLSTRYRQGVSVAYADGHRSLPIEVSVADDGPGPPAEIAEHMFEPFVSSKARGRGLGLALVEKLMGDTGGIVQFVRENDRSVFRLLLPRAA